MMKLINVFSEELGLYYSVFIGLISYIFCGIYYLWGSLCRNMGLPIHDTGQSMWNCGCVPVSWHVGRVVGPILDRKESPACQEIEKWGDGRAVPFEMYVFITLLFIS